MVSPAKVLIASGFGSGGGGLFVLGPAGFERLDHLETTGMAVSPDGRSLIRALLAADSDQLHLLRYSDSGIDWYRHSQGLGDPHGVVWTAPDEFAVANTGTNSVDWFDGDGLHLRSWQPPGHRDAWHLNCPAVTPDGRLVVSAFGRFTQHREWVDAMRAGRPTGLVVEAGTGATVLDGLLSPHDPLPLDDGGWLVCNTAACQVLHLDAGGGELARGQLDLWTRGLTLTEDAVYVGQSRDRHSGAGETAAVVELDRTTLTERRRWRLPVDEVFSIAWVDEALLGGLRLGLGALPGLRVDPATAQVMSRAGHERALEPADWLATVAASGVPAETTADDVIRIEYRATSHTNTVLESGGSLPVRIGVRWETQDAQPLTAGGRASLPYPLVNGGSASGVVMTGVPDEPGTYELVVAVLQENVAWFDTLDASQGSRHTVRVVAAPTVPAS